MRPPICYLCGNDFRASSGKLLRFVLSEKCARWEARQAEQRSPGHHPDDGWFCGPHAAAAEPLAADRTLREALVILRDATTS